MPTDLPRSENRPPHLLRKNGAPAGNGRPTPGRRILRRFVVVARTGIALMLALAALDIGLVWATNWIFPQAVLHTIGLDEVGRGWEARWMRKGPFSGGRIEVRRRTAYIDWSRCHREKRGRSDRYLFRGSWSAGVRTNDFRQPYKRREADGSRVDYSSFSVVFLEVPLWSVFPILGAYPTVVLFRGPIRRLRRRRRGLCLHCGYDVRLLTEPRCPECGTPTENEPAD